jgi:hypothetical protein
VLLIFALLHGFIAKEIWQRNEDAVQIVRAEGDALRALEHLTADSDPAARRLQDLIRAYAQSVVEDEWPRMRERRDAPQAEAAFARLLSAVVAAPASGGSGPEVERVRLDTVLKLHTLRGTRLAIAGDRTNELKWAILLLLGIVAQIAIAAVHLEMPRPQIAGLTIFTMAAVISLGLVAVQERPFSPPLEVPPAPLLEVVHEIPAR